jgi:hypothetical protein
MKMLYQPVLDEREFGVAALSVKNLLAWVESQGALLPRTDPDIQTFDGVHIESLLCAIERGAHAMSDDEIVRAAGQLISRGVALDDARLREMILVERDLALSRWFYGANCHLSWRRWLQSGLAIGALRAIDATTGIPIVVQAEAPSITTAEKKEVQYREAILAHLRSLAFDPKALPPWKNGTADTAKGAVRKALSGQVIPASSFEKAWQQLLASGEILRRSAP